MPGIVSRCDLQILEEKTCAKNASGRRKTEIGIVRKRERKDFGHPFFLANTDFQWVCVCVFFVLYSTGKLPMYVMQFCCSLTAPDFSTAPDSFALSFAHHLPSLSPGLQLNLKFLHNPTKLGAKIWPNAIWKTAAEENLV